MNVSTDEYPVSPTVVGRGAVFVEHRLKTPQVSESAYIAPTAVLAGDVIVGSHSGTGVFDVHTCDRRELRPDEDYNWYQGDPPFIRYPSAEGVRLIRAAGLEDALVAQGYATAQDRLFQMDLLRRFNAGDLAEVFGPAALESDREARRLRLRRIAEDSYRSLPPADRAAFGGYARGVNAFVSMHLSNLPLEFTLAGYQPRPWSACRFSVCSSSARPLSRITRLAFSRRRRRSRSSRSARGCR